MLADYPGTLLLVSHDRDFLDRVVTSVVASDGDGRWTEYAGGYSDMLAQRGEDLARETPARSAKEKAREPREEAASPDARSGRRKLSFKDKHALEMLPTTIATLQEKIAALHTKLDDPSLYARDRKAFDQTSATLADAQAELALAEERWLELEILREEIEAG
jgi:ATP-binding cassette subfamily F protein uup